MKREHTDRQDFGSAPAAPDADEGRRKPLALRLSVLALFIAAFAAAYALGLHRYLSLDWISEQRAMLHGLVEAYPASSAILFVIVYVAVVALSLPAASVLTILSGFLFGGVIGGILTVAAATIGSCLLFVAARTVFGDVLKRRAGPFIERFAEGFSRNAFTYLLVLRLAPVFPFFIVNIAPAFLPVSLRTFFLATMIGIIPGTFAYAWLGRGFEKAIADAAGEGRSLALADFVTPELSAAFILLAVIAALPLIVQAVRGKAQGLPKAGNE